ncbi:WD repeat-containing protein jip5 [Ascosphaera pollenicola]|nr:WD repeat-containing protein jip5 [Ascosphaera pollenicola]
MFDTVCSYPLKADLFAQAIHPSEPLVSVGLSSGHVETFRLPPTDGDVDDGQKGRGHIDTIWRTRRHKGSCRTLAYGLDGETLYSSGTDGIIKAAKADTGVVTSKIVVPRVDSGSSEIDAPTVIHALSPQTLLLSTDSGALHVYDLRIPSDKVTAKPQQTHHPHDDYVSSLTPLPPSETSTSGFSKQWITTGGTTIALTDLRRGVLVRSEDQEEELVSSAYVTGLKKGGSSQGEKLLVGGSSGILTLWEKGAWDDQDERIVVSKDRDGAESLEVISVLPDGLSAQKTVAIGQTDGHVQLVQIGSNRVVATLQHDELEGVTGLGFDVDGRMVSGGGNIVKVWHAGEDNGDFDDDSDDDDEDSDDDEVARKGSKRGMESDEDSSDDEGSKRRRKKKGKKGKKGRGGSQQVMGFSGLD